MRQTHKIGIVFANTTLALALLAPASASALRIGSSYSPASASGLTSAVTLAAMAEMVPLTSTQVTYDMGMDPEMMQVFEGVYTNDHPNQVEDIRVRVRKYSHPANVLLSDEYQSVTNDYILGSGQTGTYRVELPMSADVMWDVSGPYAMHGASLSKRMTAVVTSSLVDANGYRHYFGEVMNDSTVNVPLTDIRVSGQERVNGSFFAEASDANLFDGGKVLAPMETARFELIATRPTGGATPTITGVKAEGRFQTVLRVTTSSFTPNYGAAIKLTGSLLSAGTRTVLPSQKVSFVGTSLNSRVKPTEKFVSWNGLGYFASVVPPFATKYRVRFEGDSNYGVAVSPEIRVTPKVSLSVPSAPATQIYGRNYINYGYLKARHSAGTYPVRIYRWRLVSGKWKAYGYVKAKASNYSSYTKYATSMKLPAKGKWRLKAVHPVDSLNAATTSGYRYVTVK